MNTWKILGISRFTTKKGISAVTLHMSRPLRESVNNEGNEVYSQFVMADMIPAGLQVGDEVRVYYNRNAFVEAIEIVA